MEKMVLPSTLTMSSGAGTSSETEVGKTWPAFISPGEEHKILTAEIGSWNLEFFFFPAPGAAPQKGFGTSVHKSIMGGRYIQSVYEGTIMGMPFEGQALIGHDNHRKIYFCMWIDDVGTDILYSEGHYNAEKKQIEFIGKRTDPETGEPTVCKQYWMYTDETNIGLQRFAMHKDEEYLSMEVKFTRTA